MTFIQMPDDYTKTYFSYHDVKRLSKSADYFASVLAKNRTGFSSNTYTFLEIFRYKHLFNHSRFRSEFNHALDIHISCFESVNKNKYSKYGIPEVNLFKKAKQYLYPELKIKLLDTYKKSIDKFSYPAQKRIIAELITAHQHNEDELLQVLESHHNKLTNANVRFILNNIKDGIQNKRAIKVINDSNKIRTVQYVEEDMKDDAKRLEVLKNLATTPTSIKYLDFNVKFTYEDLKKLAPVMRFKFLKFVNKAKLAYSGDIVWMKRYHNYNSLKYKIDRMNKKQQISKIDISSITDEQIKELLFAVGIKKNVEVTKFLDACINHDNLMQELKQQKPHINTGMKATRYW